MSINAINLARNAGYKMLPFININRNDQAN